MLTGLPLLGIWITEPKPVIHYKFPDRRELKNHKIFAIYIKQIYLLIKGLLQNLQNQKIIKSDDRARGEIEKLILRLRKLKTSEFIDKKVNGQTEDLIQQLHTLRLIKSPGNVLSEKVKNLLQELDEETEVKNYEGETWQKIKNLMRELYYKILWEVDCPTQEDIENLIEELQLLKLFMVVDREIKQFPNLEQIVPNNKEIEELKDELKTQKNSEFYDKVTCKIIKKLLEELPRTIEIHFEYRSEPEMMKLFEEISKLESISPDEEIKELVHELEITNKKRLL